MKGIVFNLLEEVINEQLGPDVWDGILDGTGLTGAYTSLGSYPDTEIASLVETAASTLGKSPAEVLRWFGRTAIPNLAQRFPIFFEPHKSSRDFILSVNSIIHPEVRKLYAGAGCPHFQFREGKDGALMISYQSARKLCDLAHGFIEGAGDHFGEQVDISHLACMNHGDPNCQIAVRWAS
jgi:hypothetical protein